MPYGGEESEAEVRKMERCVKKVMKSDSFAKTYRNRPNKSDSRKQVAVKICKKAVL